MKKIFFILLTLITFVLLFSGCKKVNTSLTGTYYYAKNSNEILTTSYIRVYKDNTADIHNITYNNQNLSLTLCKFLIEKNGKVIKIYHSGKFIGEALFLKKTIRVNNQLFIKK